MTAPEPKEPDVTTLDDPSVPYSLVPVGDGTDALAPPPLPFWLRDRCWTCGELSNAVNHQQGRLIANSPLWHFFVPVESKFRSPAPPPLDLESIIRDIEEALASWADTRPTCVACGTNFRNESRLNRAMLSGILQRLRAAAAPVVPVERPQPESVLRLIEQRLRKAWGDKTIGPECPNEVAIALKELSDFLGTSK